MRKKLILAAYCALLCITVTFSWLFDILPNHVYEVVVDYQNNGLFIVNANMEAKLYMQEEDNGEYVEVKEDFAFDGTRLIPNAVIPFYIDVTNNGDTSSLITVTVLMNVEDPTLLDVLYIDVVVASDDSNTGKHVYRKLSEAVRVGDERSTEYSLTLYGSDNRLFVRGGETTVKLDCYLYFDRNADSTHQGKSLEITSFRLEQ